MLIREGEIGRCQESGTKQPQFGEVRGRVKNAFASPERGVGTAGRPTAPGHGTEGMVRTRH